MRVEFVGFVSEISGTLTAKTAKKSKYIKLLINDDTAATKVLIFNNKIDECKDLNVKMPVEGDIVIVIGSMKDECVFADIIATQNSKIYSRLSELKDFKAKETVAKEARDNVHQLVMNIAKNQGI